MVRTTTILSHTNTRLKTANPLDILGYQSGVVFKNWTERCATEIVLDHDELQTFLALLPPSLLLAALESPCLPLGTANGLLLCHVRHGSTMSRQA